MQESNDREEWLSADERDVLRYAQHLDSRVRQALCKNVVPIVMRAQP